jgi:hypothetical protein
MIGKARQQEVFSRDDTSTERRILAASLYYAGLSYRRFESFVDRSYEAIVVLPIKKRLRAGLPGSPRNWRR